MIVRLKKFYKKIKNKIWKLNLLKMMKMTLMMMTLMMILMLKKFKSKNKIKIKNKKRNLVKNSYKLVQFKIKESNFFLIFELFKKKFCFKNAYKNNAYLFYYNNLLVK